MRYQYRRDNKMPYVTFFNSHKQRYKNPHEVYFQINPLGIGLAWFKRCFPYRPYNIFKLSLSLFGFGMVINIGRRKAGERVSKEYFAKNKKHG